MSFHEKITENALATLDNEICINIFSLLQWNAPVQISCLLPSFYKSTCTKIMYKFLKK